MHQSTLLPILALALGVAAKTNIGGCVSTEVPYMTRDTLVYRSLLWYLPDTGEICEFLDCGGGRAPPKTNVPGCGNYAGTEEYKPRFWTGFNAEPTTSVVAPAKPTTNVNTALAVTTTTKTKEVPVETGAAETGESSETEGPAPTTLVTVSSSATGAGAGSETKTVEEVVVTTEAPDAGGAEKGQSGGGSGASSASSTSVLTAGAAPTGAVMMGVVAGVAAGLAFVA